VAVLSADLLEEPRPLARIGVLAELQEAVVTPVGAVRHVPRRVAGLEEIARHAERAHVLVRDLVPHAVLNEDVRRHVDRVRDGRDDLGVDVRGLERQRRVHRIVERVNDVVHRARMVRIPLEHAEGERSGLHLQPQAVVGQRSRAAEQRQRIERGHLVIVGELPVQPLHRLHVGDLARTPVGSLGPELLHRLEEPAFACGRRLRQARSAIGAEASEHLARVLVV
jgi:hypothetical protein